MEVPVLGRAKTHALMTLYVVWGPDNVYTKLGLASIRSEEDDKEVGARVLEERRPQLGITVGSLRLVDKNPMAAAVVYIDSIASSKRFVK
jgi:hypothetical protein